MIELLKVRMVQWWLKLRGSPRYRDGNDYIGVGRS